MQGTAWPTWLAKMAGPITRKLSILSNPRFKPIIPSCGTCSCYLVKPSRRSRPVQTRDDPPEWRLESIRSPEGSGLQMSQGSCFPNSAWLNRPITQHFAYLEYMVARNPRSGHNERKCGVGNTLFKPARRYCRRFAPPTVPVAKMEPGLLLPLAHCRRLSSPTNRRRYHSPHIQLSTRYRHAVLFPLAAGPSPLDSAHQAPVRAG